MTSTSVDSKAAATVDHGSPLSRLGAWFAERRFTVYALGGALAVWSMLATWVFPPVILPSPWQIAQTTAELMQTGEWFGHVSISLRRVAMGFANGSLWGVVWGLIMGRWATPRGLMMPVVNIVRPLSPVALAPLVIIWFGIGETSKVLLVGYTAFIAIMFNTMTGVASASQTRERAARCMGASEFQILRSIVFPSAIPAILTGMRIGIGFCFLAIVAAELLAAQQGIGFLIMQSRYTMRADEMFVGLVTLAILGFFADMLFRKAVQKTARAYLGKEVSDRAF